MSGGPPHHPHGGRQVPAAAANPAWNHLQVPNYFPSRQPQHAHMSNDHSFLHQPTWHTPTTEAMKTIPHSHLFSLEQMFSDRQFTRHTPGVDLSVTRNGSQNGDIPTSPISLSVRDTNKINSLPPSALEVQAVELTKCPASPAKSISPGVKPLSVEVKPVSPSIKPASPCVKPASPGVLPMSPGVLPMSPGMKPASPSFKPASPSIKPASPSVKPASPSVKPASPGIKIHSPGVTSVLATTPVVPENSKNLKRSNKRVDSILERLNPMLEKVITAPSEPVLPEKPAIVTDAPIPEVQSEKLPITTPSQSVIVQAAVSSHDENSNSSSILNVPTPTPKDDDVLSPYSNEDSLDSNKSRRKRKPAKTVRVAKEDDKAIDSDTDLAKTLEDSITEDVKPPLSTTDSNSKLKEETCSKEEMKERRPSLSEDELVKPAKTRRKTSSESETIDNIAAMVQEVIEEKKSKINDEIKKEEVISKPVSVSVIKTNESLQAVQEILTPKEAAVPIETPAAAPMTHLTPAQKKATNTHFVEVENKLEEMFAGIEDSVDPLKNDHLDLGDDSKMEDDSLLKLEDSIASTSHDVSSTSNETSICKMPQKKPAKKVKSAVKKITDNSDNGLKKKKLNKKSKSSDKQSLKSSSIKAKSLKPKSSLKVDSIKDIYAYDSGSNASSNKSKGPFIHIRGPRDSPISVDVINTPTNDDDPEKKPNKTKKYHDDSEYRHKVRSKGLHSSTLSNKYDAQTRDISWICAFCKRGPHGSHLSDPSHRSFEIAPGDLFGPYFIGTTTPEFERRLEDPYDKQFKSKKIAKMIDLTSAQPAKITGKKTKRKHSDSFESRGSSTEEVETYLGITDTGNKTYEVWAHEDCIVWSPGVYLVGSKIVGLEEAVWTCCNVMCSKCNLKGANICCLNRGCTKVLHYCCAKSSDWVLDEVHFKAYCSIHKITP